jgi:hypothetical protein
MNKHEQELRGYIDGTERMSGFDSYDSAEGDMDYFDGDSMDNFDGDSMSYATGRASVSVADPYVLNYTNTTSSDVTAYLFGFNDFIGVANGGNVAAVVVTNLQGGTYGRLLAQSNNKPFKISKWRFKSATASQLEQTLTFTHYDGNGKSYNSPFNLSIERDSYQQLSDQIDATKPLTVDGNTQVSFTLKGSASLTITMFPTSLMSPKAQLNGSQMLHNSRAPRLSGKNVSPVIIQTSQDVKGITKG